MKLKTELIYRTRIEGGSIIIIYDLSFQFSSTMSLLVVSSDTPLTDVSDMDKSELKDHDKMRYVQQNKDEKLNVGDIFGFWLTIWCLSPTL